MHISKAKTRSRRSHHRAGAPRLTKDAKTGSTHVRHFADPVTGTYRGKPVGKKQAAKKADRALAGAKKAAAKKQKGDE